MIDAPPHRRTCILVLGMHRSGTSAITRAVSLMGAALPKTLLGANSSNPLGHWEPEPLVSLHDELLAELGSKWDGWEELDLTRLAPDRQHHYRTRIQECIADQFGSYPLFVVKDPRICRFVGLFSEALEAVGIDLRFVLQVRDPAAVVQSLRRRNGTPAEQGGLLWLRHFLDAERATRGLPRVVGSYEQLLDRCDAAIDDLWAAWPDLWPRRPEEALGDIRDVVRPELQHLPDDAERGAPPRLRSMLEDVNAALRELASGHAFADATGRLDQVRAELSGYVIDRDTPTPTELRNPRGATGGMIVAAFFYRNPQLVLPLYDSLVRTADELAAANAEVVFVNDSPDDDELGRMLDAVAAERRGFTLTVLRNEENLGFVKSANAVFDLVAGTARDVVLLNSDAMVFSGWLTEMRAVAASDPMIGFVSPRSNNATICTLPHGADLLELTPFEHALRHRAIASRMPRLSYVPTAVGFCLLIKSAMIAEFGGFDPIYGAGYNEENDLIMRANECGYRAALANWAFVWHMGEESFATSSVPRNARERENSAVLVGRYPHYPQIINEYQNSWEYRAEALLGTLAPESDGRLSIGFDLTSLTTMHNGTFQAAKQLLRAAVRVWPQDIRIIVFGERRTLEFHGLADLDRMEVRETHDASTRVAAMLRIGQPFDRDALNRLIVRAPVVGIMMLDTIAADIGKLRTGLDELLWRFVLRWTDALFGNSSFTVMQYRRRYDLNPRGYFRASLHSVTPADYADRLEAGPADNGEYYLIVGNHFPHKGLKAAVAKLGTAFPEHRFVVLGTAGTPLANVEYRESGSLSDAQVDSLFAGSRAVVFPTHYEGFGFPLMHALAQSKPILVRRLPPFLEMVERLGHGADNVHWFDTLDDLERQVRSGVPKWMGAPASGEVDGWGRSALEILDGMRVMMEAAGLKSVAERLRWHHAAFGGSPSYARSQATAVGEHVGRVLGARTEMLVAKVLRNPVIFAIARLIWRGARRLGVRNF